MAATGYNFGTAAYRGILRTKLPQADGKKLREKTVEYIKKFEKKSWSEIPIVSYLHGELLEKEQKEIIPTIDAFGRENGKQVLASKSGVDKVIHFMQNAKDFHKGVNKDYLQAGREIDAILCDHARLAPVIIGNQCLDFQKQDGITEIEESIQANLLEMRMNELLLKDEANGLVNIQRDNPIIIGCVSNFSNFLDLFRKTLRQIEVGVPCVVFSRTNTTQHMFRWFLLLQDLMKEKGMPSYLLSYLSSTVEEQRRVMQACPLSPMHFTGSREVAAKIKEVNPRLIASTGGPNTLVSTECSSQEIQNVVQMSNLIENKGQCTALRQWVNLECSGRGEAGGAKITAETLEKMYGNLSEYKTDAVESVQTNAFSGILKCALNKEGGDQKQYRSLHSRPEVHYKINENELPVNIEEHWRKLYIDCTNLNESKINELIDWLNVEQPISLAVNDDSWDLKRRFFEGTGLCVYTFGTKAKGYALTAQARPQDGEVFGEFPPRKTLDDVSRYPMLNPVPCSTWNTVFSDEYLIQHSKDRVIDPKVGGMVESIMNKIESPQFRGYAQLITEYLSDSCASNPHSVSKDNGCGRTSYFGLQRPPIVNNYVTLINYGEAANKDLFLLHVLPFAITNSHSQCVVNLSNGGESLKELITTSLGLKVIDSADVSGLRLFNEINVNNVAKDFEFCLPFQFCSKLFCLGHCKSTIPNDDEFLTEFMTSKKWLKLRN